MKNNILYISYDGILEPLGQSQVLAYLERLAENFNIYLISFEKHSDWCKIEERSKLEARMKASAITWYPSRYHKFPSAIATGFDVMVGVFLGVWIIGKRNIRIVHARSYVPAVIALVLKRLIGVAFVFDMRGFWADERVDGGLWRPNSVLYFVAKYFERRFLQSADHVISLTQSAVLEMQKFPYLQGRMPPVTIIPTCVDTARFNPTTRAVKAVNFTLGYVGSAGTWYLFDEVIRCFLCLNEIRKDARLLIVNRGDHQYIRDRLAAFDVAQASVELISVGYDTVPLQIARMDAGIFFYRPSFSRAACAPTKLGEFLACGVPCIGNIGVGDMTEILEGERVGVVLRSFDDKARMDSMRALLELVDDPFSSTRCVAAAEKYFSLEQGVARYANVYRQLENA